MKNSGEGGVCCCPVTARALALDLFIETTAVLYSGCVRPGHIRVPVCGGLFGLGKTHQWFAQDVVAVCHCSVVTSAPGYVRSVEKLTVRPLRLRLKNFGLRLNRKLRLLVKLPRRNWRPDGSSADRTSETSFEQSARSAGTSDLNWEGFSSGQT